MKRIFVHLDRCTGCRTCLIECAVAHAEAGDLFGAMFETPRPYPRLFVEAVDGHKVPVLCRHCDDAPCLSACIAGALHRDPETDAVLCDWDRCIGCWTCIMVCPYGVVRRQPELGKAVKCDLCVGLDAVACVESCPVGALELAEPDAFAAQRRAELVAGVTS